jgi:TP901 family phage tail tape measure protein
MFQVPAVFKAVDKMSAPIKKIERNMSGFTNRANAGISRLDRNVNRLTPSFKRLNGVMGNFGMFLGATAIAGGVGSAIGVFADFEQANSNLAAVLGKTSKETADLQKQAKLLGATTAFTASEVAGLQTEYAKLGFSQKEILNSAAPTLALAAATNTELGQSATQVGAALRAFGMDTSEAARVADVFAASTSKSALDMEKLNTAMSIVAPVAKQFGFSVEESTALLGKLADAGFDASTAATSTRNIFLNMADANGKLAKALGGPVRNIPDLVKGLKNLKNQGIDLASMLELTDKRSVAAFATFLEGADGVAKLTKELEGAAGTAQRMADIQLDNLRGSITKLSSAWEGWILSNEDGSGAIGGTIRGIIDMTTEMLSLWSGTQKADEALTEYETTIRRYAKIFSFAIKAVAIYVGLLLTLKTVLFISRTALAAYNIVLGISTALQNKNLFALRGNTVALAAYRAATLVATAANWLLNASNPVGWILILIGAVAAVVTYWEEWGAAISVLLGPLGLLISLVQSFREHWGSIVTAFQEGGIVAGLKRIGFVLIDALLMPIQSLLELVARIPGMGDLAGSGAKFIEDLRLGLDEASQVPPAVNPKADEAAAKVSREESIEQQRLSIDINDKSNGRATVKNDGIPVNLAPTFAM